METKYVKPDSRNRIVLTKATNNPAKLYKIYQEGDKIILEPVNDIPEREKWLYEPKNRKLVDELKKRLREERATIDLGTFKQYLEDDDK